MKWLKIFSFVLFFVMALYFLIFSFSDISIAEQTSIQNCISNCAQKQQACFNINADRRLCNAEFQNCTTACNSESDSPSSMQPSTQQESKPAGQLE